METTDPVSYDEQATVPDSDHDEQLQAVVRCVSALLADAPAPQRINVRAGAVAVELEWPSATPAVAYPPAPLYAPAPAAPVAPLAAVPAPAPAAAAVPAAVAAEAPADNRTYIKSTSVGTFYRASEPGAAPFVSEGDVVSPGQQVAILEAMKLMLPVESSLSGKVVEFLVESGTPVEFDTPLIALAPAA